MAKKRSMAVFAVLVVIAFALPRYVGSVYQIPSASTNNTLWVGDYIWCNKLSYAFSTPDRNDIVVFREPSHPHENLIKRCIGLPGETIQLKKGLVYINGSVQERINTARLVVPDTSNSESVAIPAKNMTIGLTALNIARYRQVLEVYEGVLLSFKFPFDSTQANFYTFKQNYYYMFGDNRPSSVDSRIWELVPQSCLGGRCTRVLFSV